jgi:hypothetical protein
MYITHCELLIARLNGIQIEQGFGVWVLEPYRGLLLFARARYKHNYAQRICLIVIWLW